MPSGRGQLNHVETCDSHSAGMRKPSAFGVGTVFNSVFKFSAAYKVLRASCQQKRRRKDETIENFAHALEPSYYRSWPENRLSAKRAGQITPRSTGFIP